MSVLSLVAKFRFRGEISFFDGDWFDCLRDWFDITEKAGLHLPTLGTWNLWVYQHELARNLVRTRHDSRATTCRFEGDNSLASDRLVVSYFQRKSQ